MPNDFHFSLKGVLDDHGARTLDQVLLKCQSKGSSRHHRRHRIGALLRTLLQRHTCQTTRSLAALTPESHQTRLLRAVGKVITHSTRRRSSFQARLRSQLPEPGRIVTWKTSTRSMKQTATKAVKMRNKPVHRTHHPVGDPGSPERRRRRIPPQRTLRIPPLAPRSRR